LLFCCVKFRGTTKEAFVANAIRFALEHRQLFIHQHVTKVLEAVTKYCTNMGIPSSSSYSEK
jgi:hypothetical protein